jgi:MFS family permease
MLLQNKKLNARRAAISSFVGTAIEFYDFYIYATAAAIVLGDVFFPNLNQFNATMASFATFAVGFIARPLSGMMFGHFGDRIGRKKMLVITMFLMGFASTSIGLLPTYNQVGILAPVLLIFLRVLQGVAVGGEWGGAVLMASEHAPPGRKTFYASLPQMGSPVGLILALSSFKFVESMSHENFISWGWRLPFLASFALLLIGAFVRTGISESPEFEAIVVTGEIVRYPTIEVVRTAWVKILLAAGATTISTAGFYFTNTFMISYVTTYLGMQKSTILDVLLIVTIIQLCSQPVSALLAERFGNAKFLVVAMVISFLSPYSMFLLVNTQNSIAMIVGISIAVVSLSAVYAVIAGYMISVFPIQLRYSGISIAYQTCCAITGGTTPLICTLIAGKYVGQWQPLALYFSVLAGISLSCFLGLYRYQQPARVKLNTFTELGTHPK